MRSLVRCAGRFASARGGPVWPQMRGAGAVPELLRSGRLSGRAAEEQRVDPGEDGGGGDREDDAGHCDRPGSPSRRRGPRRE